MVSTLVVQRNTYLSLADATAYLADSLRGSAWANYDEDTQAQALITATRIFQRQSWAGEPSGLLEVAAAAITAGGAGYAVGDVLTVVGGTTDVPAQVRVATAPGGVVGTVSILDAGLYTALPSNPAATTGGSGSGATLALTQGSQVLDWPRTGVARCDGSAVASTTVPQEIKDAQCELALDMLLDADVESQAGTGSNIARVRAGSAEVEFFRPTDGSGRQQRFSNTVMELLACLLGGSGVGTLSIVTGTDVESSFDHADEYNVGQGFP